MTIPEQPKIYHIVHIDRLSSIIDNGLCCDAEVLQRGLSPSGTTIGMKGIKQRRLRELTLESYPKLHVGDCVPFYFCPRSIMLYLIHQANNPELDYLGGQESIVHLEADLNEAVNWANTNQRRWAFTLSNAGARYFESRNDLSRLHEVDWDAVHSIDWKLCKDGKQAEFLVESIFPWKLIERVGVYDKNIYNEAANKINAHEHRPKVEIKPEWYY